MKLEVFDPPMCCSTGVCGPSVPPALSRFAGDLEWLSAKGIDVTRHNLAHEPQAFIASEQAHQALTEQGNDALPLILIDGAAGLKRPLPVPLRARRMDRTPGPEGKVSLSMAPPVSGSGGCCGGTGAADERPIDTA